MVCKLKGKVTYVIYEKVYNRINIFFSNPKTERSLLGGRRKGTLLNTQVLPYVATMMSVVL